MGAKLPGGHVGQSELRAMKRRRLSGWARLFTVVAVLVWAAATWGAFHVWGAAPPSFQMSRQSVCSAYTYGDEERIASGETLREACATNRFAELAARKRHREHVQSFLGLTLLAPIFAASATFALLMLAKSATLWVWRGFRPSDHGSAK